MIHVLCWACNTHLADTDVARLDWPMHGEMFSVVYPGWFLRPGMLNLNIFCPACGNFPFSHDPYTAGANAVGKNLNVRGADGKPTVMTIKQILMRHGGTYAVPSPHPVITTESIKQVATAFKMGVESTGQCPHCGAKPSKGGKVQFHKKGCFTQAEKSVVEGPADTHVLGECHNVSQENQPFPDRAYKETIIQPIDYGPDGQLPVPDKHARLSEKKDLQRAQDPFIAGIAGRVSGAKGDKGEGPPTVEEVKEMLAERENRREKEEPDLRPGEGYLPQVAR